MARITVEDCLEQIPNRFSLVLVAAERTKQLLTGSDELIDDDRSNKEVVTALREIAAGVVRVDTSAFDENENLREFTAAGAEEDLPPAADGDDLLPPEADALPPEADALPPAPEDEALAAEAK